MLLIQYVQGSLISLYPQKFLLLFVFQDFNLSLCEHAREHLVLLSIAWQIDAELGARGNHWAGVCASLICPFATEVACRRFAEYKAVEEVHSWPNFLRHRSRQNMDKMLRQMYDIQTKHKHTQAPS